MTRLASAFQSSLLPLVATDEDDGRRTRTTAVALRHHAILAGASILAIAVLGPVLIVVGFGSEFRPAVLPMLILLPGLWFLGTGIVVGADLGGRERPGTSSLLSGITVGATVVLDLVLIPPFGVAGAALASTLAYTCFGVASAVVLSRIIHVPLRELLVPRRADLARYPAALGMLARRLRRPSPRPSPPPL